MKTTCSWMLKGKHPPKRMLEKLVSAAAELAGVTDCRGVSVIFLPDDRMAEMNQASLGHPGPTDVISFDLRVPGMPSDPEGDAPEIELYVAPFVALREAVKRNLPYAQELTLYIVHGLLHMAGEDDLCPQAKRRMRRAEKRVMAALEQAFDFEKVFGNAPGPERAE